MEIRKSELLLLIIVLFSFAVGAYAYHLMPEMVASHWNAQGEVDGYMAKAPGLFLLPFLSFCLFLLFAVCPRIDPLKANIRKFIGYFDMFIILFGIFLFYLYVLTILWNMGARFNMIQLLAPAFAALFFYLGVLTGNAKRNWSIGIRTPWTLSSDRIWDKTHALGGKLFKTAAVVALLGLLVPQYAILFVLVPVILAAFAAAAYSYFEYSRLQN